MSFIQGKAVPGGGAQSLWAASPFPGDRREEVRTAPAALLSGRRAAELGRRTGVRPWPCSRCALPGRSAVWAGPVVRTRHLSRPPRRLVLREAGPSALAPPLPVGRRLGPTGAEVRVLALGYLFLIPFWRTRQRDLLRLPPVLRSGIRSLGGRSTQEAVERAIQNDPTRQARPEPA